MTLDRPPRATAGAVTERVRKAILAEGDKRGLGAPAILTLHTEGDHLGDIEDLLDDVDRRYQLQPGTIGHKAAEVVGDARKRAGFSYGGSTRNLAAEEWARAVLFALPDTEFLTAIEHALELADQNGLHPQTVVNLHAYADQALRSHGAPYRGVTANLTFEWVGDPKQHQLVVDPALRALADSRLTGPRAEFEEALHKRRGGSPKELEDAVDEAAKSVESCLKVLHDECGVERPRSENLTPLFNSLVTGNVLPGYVDKLVAAAAGPRNQMASHGQGGAVREVPWELADASIAAAATAITFLAHYLP